MIGEDGTSQDGGSTVADTGGVVLQCGRASAMVVGTETGSVVKSNSGAAGAIAPAAAVPMAPRDNKKLRATKKGSRTKG